MANINVYIVLDFFFQDWNNNAPLWVVAQPHVAKGDLANWVAGCSNSTGAGYQYQFFTKDATGVDPKDFVPVPFPSDVDLQIDFHAATPLTIRNLRTTTPVVLHAQQLQDDNLSPDADTGNLKSFNDNEVFTKGYTRNVQGAFNGMTSDQARGPRAVEDLAHMLRLAFWGGTRWDVRATAVNVLDPANTMFVETPDAKRTVTNLHSLLGLVFRIGTKADIVNLQTIDRVSLTLNVGAASQVVVSGMADQCVKYFFASLPGLRAVPSVTLKPDSTRNQVVFLQQNLVSFVFTPIGSESWYRRRREDSNEAALLTLGNLNGISVRWKTPSSAPGNETLAWNFFRSFEVQLAPYRDVRLPDDATKPTLLQLKPVHDEEEEFFASIDEQGTWWNDARIVSGSSAKPAFVGAYGFPWDDGKESHTRKRTLLFFGPAPKEPGITIMLTCRDLAGQPITVQTTEMTDVLEERRWEWKAPPRLPDAHFDAILTTTTSGTIQFTELRPALAFDGDLTFTFSQSVHNVGIGVDAVYPDPPMPQQVNQVTAENEFEHDLVNYNSLNLFSKWTTIEDRWLNQFSEVYPISTSRNPGNSTIVQTFNYHGARPGIAPPDVDKPDPLNLEPRKFFAEIYQNAGIDRVVTLKVEHTYGFMLDPLPTAVKTWLDFTPTLPSDVSFVDASGTRTPFVTLSFDASKNEATLNFELDFLKMAWQSVDPDNRRPIRTAAWRAIAEMRYAKTLRFVGLFLDYDFRTLLNSKDSTKLINAFVPVAALDGWEVALDGLRQRCDQWLGQDVPTKPTVTIPLELRGLPKITDVADVFELQLDVVRADTAVPPQNNSWRFFVSESLRGNKNVTFDDVRNRSFRVDPSIAFERFRQQLAGRRQSIPVSSLDAETDKATNRFHRLVGDTKPEQFEAHGAWIAVEKTSLPAVASATVCPVTFLPLNIDPALGPDTFTLISRYFRGLEIVCGCAVAETRGFDTADKWKAYLKPLQDATTAIESMVARAIELLLPIPNPQNTALGAEIKDVLTNVGSWQPSLNEWVRSHLIQNPSIFGTTQAFLYSRLNDLAGGLLTPDMFRMTSEKLLPAEPNPERLLSDMSRGFPKAAAPTAQQFDRDRITVRDALVDLAASTWFGVAEILDDRRYGSKFNFSRTGLTSFDALLASVLENPSDDDTTDIVIRKLNLPGGTETGAGDTDVRLVSRDPLKAPVHAFTGYILNAQTYQGMDQFDPTKNGGLNLDFRRFIHGQLQTVALHDPGVRMQGRATAGMHHGRADTCMISVLLSITGDSRPFPTNYDRDAFFFLINKAEGTAITRTKMAPFPWGTDFVKLKQAADPAALANLAGLVLQPETLLKMPDALSAAEGEGPIPIPELLTKPTIQITADPMTGDPDVRISGVSAADGAIDAFLFRLQGISGKAAQDFLLVNIEVPIWFSWQIAVVQGRNISMSTKPGEDFNPRFSATTDPVSDDKPFQATQVRSAILPSVPAIPRVCSLIDVVQKTLIEPANIAATDDWKGFPLSVTVYHQQQRSFEAAVDSGSGFEFPAPPFIFPVRNFRFYPSSPADYSAPRAWFPDGMSNFQFEFQWSSPRNLQFLRVNNAKVNA